MKVVCVVECVVDHQLAEGSGEVKVGALMLAKLELEV